jgi:hypothetical protein
MDSNVETDDAKWAMVRWEQWDERKRLAMRRHIIKLDREFHSERSKLRQEKNHG